MGEANGSRSEVNGTETLQYKMDITSKLDTPSSKLVNFTSLFLSLFSLALRKISLTLGPNLSSISRVSSARSSSVIACTLASFSALTCDRQSSVEPTPFCF